MAKRETTTETISSEQSNNARNLIVKAIKFGLLIGEVIFLILKALYIISKSIFALVFPISEKSVNKEIVLVTGAAHGIGKELALQYAALGATVVCWDVEKDYNQATVNEIASLGYPKAYGYECDVTNQTLVMDTANKVQQEVGTVTILINNAGIGYFKPLLKQPPIEIETTLNVNILSHFWTIQAFLPKMVENNYGHIVAICSAAGLFGGKYYVPYCASKFAVRGMMEAFYQELRLIPNCRIKLTTIYPYMVNTGFYKRVFVRFQKLMPILDARSVAKIIITAQRTNISEQSIPKSLYGLLSVLKSSSTNLPVRILSLLLLMVETIYIPLRILYATSQFVFRLVFPVGKKSVSKDIVLVTGAASGIGKELALQYAAHGATVVCWDILKDKNQETADEIVRLGYTKAYAYECDISKQTAVMETAKQVQQEVGDITILVNNAGVAYAKSVLYQTQSEIENVFNVNVLSHFWTIKAFLPPMLKNNYGHIVATCSFAGLIAGKYGTSYCASKFAVRGMMEALYQELRLKQNCSIKLTTIYPNHVNTNFFKRMFIRFPKLAPILDVQSVAEKIISAQRRDVFELSIPRFTFSFSLIVRMFPITVLDILYDFLNISHETY